MSVEKPDYSDHPIAWFGELLLAKERHDFQRAAEAQRELERLGWSVKYRNPARRAKLAPKPKGAR